MDSFSTKIFFQLQMLMVCWASTMASNSNVTTCSCYGFYNQNKTWSESKTNCIKNEGNLVTMETIKEWEFITLEIQNRSTYKDEWYIGLKNETGAWKWINNKSLTNNDTWQDGQPSRDGRCVVMAQKYPESSRGLWNDLSCETRRGFICEYDTASDKCGSNSTTFPPNCGRHEATKTTESAITSTMCTKSNDDQFDLVYVVIILGILLACGIGFYIYIFYCKNRNTGFSLRCKEYRSCEVKPRTSLQMEEGADLEPLQTGEPTTETVLEDNSNKTDTTIMPTKTETDLENSAEPQLPARDTVEASAVQDYTLPADPSSTSTYASLYSTVDIEQKKPEENEDNAPPKIPSPYNKASGEPLVYATVDKSKKTKGRKSHIEVVYATVDKKRKSAPKDDT